MIDHTDILALVGAIFVANMAVIIPLFLWTRSEANSDRRESANDRRDMLQIIRNIQDEIKDFHGRLCKIEERNQR